MSGQGPLAGRTAAVTGASSGVGLAVLLGLHDLGADVVGWARRVEVMEEAAGEERLATGRLRVQALDVSDPEAVAARAAELGDRLDLLMCIAGTNVPNRRLYQLDPETWELMQGTNLAGTIHPVVACLPALRAAHGLVVVVGSVSGAWTDRSGPGYQATKAAQLAFVRAAGFEEHEHRVRFSIVQPGMIDTPLLDRRPEPPPREMRDQMLTAEDVAGLCLVLATLPPRVHVPELTVLPTFLQTIGRTT